MSFDFALGLRFESCVWQFSGEVAFCDDRKGKRGTGLTSNGEIGAVIREDSRAPSDLENRGALFLKHRSTIHVSWNELRVLYACGLRGTHDQPATIDETPGKFLKDLFLPFLRKIHDDIAAEDNVHCVGYHW